VRRSRKETLQSLKYYLRVYTRRQRVTSWVSAGLGIGLIVLVSGDLGKDVLDSAPDLIKILTLLFIGLAGFTLANAHALSEHHASKIEDKIVEIEGKYGNDSDIVYDEELPDELREKKPSQRGSGWYAATLILIVSAGGLFWVGAWWPLLSDLWCSVNSQLSNFQPKPDLTPYWAAIAGIILVCLIGGTKKLGVVGYFLVSNPKAQEDKNKRLAREWFVEVCTKGDLTSVDRLFAPNYVVHGLGLPEEAKGPDAAKQVVNVFRRTFPNIRFTVDEQIAEGDMVATRWTGHGTYWGMLMNIPVSNQVSSISGISLDRFKDEKFVESRFTFVFQA
jgi:ketosteroid isomerase-like protein